MPAHLPLEALGHSNSDTQADLPGDLDIPVAPLRMKGMLPGRQIKEPLYALHGEVLGLAHILPAFHTSSWPEAV